MNHQAIRERNSKAMDQKIKAQKKEQAHTYNVANACFPVNQACEAAIIRQQAKLSPRDPLSQQSL